MAESDHFIGELPALDALRDAAAAAYRMDETAAVDAVLARCELPRDARARIARRARRLVVGARKSQADIGGLDAFLSEYALSSSEGLVLMCLAEALLRIPDPGTADRLIRDKLATAEWERHLGKSHSIFVNASTLGLLLTGRVIALDSDAHDLGGYLGRLISHTGEPVIRAALMQAMRIMGHQFVLGRTIEEALSRGAAAVARGYRFSFDMLGEAAHTAPDAEHYFDAYVDAIATLGSVASGDDVAARQGISVKLSALHPRFEFAQRGRVLRELVPRVCELAALACGAGIGFTIDSEEAARLDISLDVFEAVFAQPGYGGWDGFGFAVQAYQKRAPAVIDWMAALARRHRRRIMVRLVKGAYWDSEIKRAQELGLDGYPVFTRKASTDVSYIACVRQLFAAPDAFYPQFASHNAHTVAVVQELAPDGAGYEFQRLHGMGESLYDQIVAPGRGAGVACRIYAPVGSHEDLLPYLVRRLLENGANSSFVNRLANEETPVSAVIADPVARTAARAEKPHPRIPLPTALYAPERTGARGIDLTDPRALEPLAGAMAEAARSGWQAGPLIDGRVVQGRARDALDPADRRRVVGHVAEAGPELVETALASAVRAAPDWDAAGAELRAGCLEAAADAMERDMAALMAVVVREAGKTVADAVSEVREAVDFCRYYAARARARFAAPETLPGPTGENNELALHGRGVFACISPWNFPIAIFTGQVAAALAAGNAVIAKPAEQTPLAAAMVVRILHRAGVPGGALHLLPGAGETLGSALVHDERIGGVAFTGSTETGRAINLALAARTGAIVPLIAETGGQNAMIVDSSALTEQVVSDVVISAFHSAGQRCSALRVLFLQKDTASRVIEMLTGAMEELAIGDPAVLATDVGPVIDKAACETLEAHAARMEREAATLYRCPLAEQTRFGTFVAPAAFELDGLDLLEREVFGPILHVVRYSADRLDEVIAAVNGTGYGLTLGIHSRIDETVRYIHSRLRAGNAYVNRSMVGAVVGVQPFGGEGLSGTGPKAGGPNYLQRFAVERTLSVNTTAMGGNATLLTLGEEED